ncbi:hypothetical protein [Cryobacterium glucosi]|uniref:hypothetical protein n=1 Tax=Cryobacterium glucosi TaxID=1259175 RepID=UPI00141B7A11|nr:hypothetical protein [Cryobacterium glucosi]
MLIKCPFCHSPAQLTPNAAHAKQVTLPLYVLKCSGCERTSVRIEPIRKQHLTVGAH